MNTNSKHTAGNDERACITLTQHATLLRQRDQAVEALKFTVATLTQPVQFSGTDSEGACAILRGDAAAVVNQARAVLASIEKRAK